MPAPRFAGELFLESPVLIQLNDVSCTPIEDQPRGLPDRVRRCRLHAFLVMIPKVGHPPRLIREVAACGGCNGTSWAKWLSGLDESHCIKCNSLLEAGSEVRLRQFLRTLSPATGALTDVAAYRHALDRWAIFYTQALHFERPDLVEMAVDTLVQAYQGLMTDTDATVKRLLVVERIYVVGSLAVRPGA